MARVRSATERVAVLTTPQIQQALDAAHAARSDAAFYGVVGMRNASRSYFIRHLRRLHSLKAIVTYALQQQDPEMKARDFHAVDAAKQVTDLNFDVVHESQVRGADREREWLSRLSRPNQRAFREKLLDLYGCCPLSGCTTLAVLEAAHVDPVAEKGVDTPANGILLRVDLHKLFDAGLLAIDPADGRVRLTADAAADYSDLCRETRFLPPKGGPPLTRFTSRWKAFEQSNKV